MNYRYRVDDQDFILNATEDAYIKDLQKRGEKGIVLLRDGKLRINLPFVRYVKETDSMTEEEERKREGYLALPLEKRKTPDVNLLKGDYGRKNLSPAFGNGSDMKPCENCQEVHLIPETKKYCLPCMAKFTKKQ